jgi:hypothetical protein
LISALIASIQASLSSDNRSSIDGVSRSIDLEAFTIRDGIFLSFSKKRNAILSIILSWRQTLPPSQNSLKDFIANLTYMMEGGQWVEWDEFFLYSYFQLIGLQREKRGFDEVGDASSCHQPFLFIGLHRKKRDLDDKHVSSYPGSC